MLKISFCLFLNRLACSEDSRKVPSKTDTENTPKVLNRTRILGLFLLRSPNTPKEFYRVRVNKIR
jgi:hypothetical protein